MSAALDHAVAKKPSILCRIQDSEDVQTGEQETSDAIKVQRLRPVGSRAEPCRASERMPDGLMPVSPGRRLRRDRPMPS